MPGARRSTYCRASGASSEAAHWLAEKENAADLVGGVSLDDKDDVLASVLLDLSQTATMQASYDAAEQVLSNLRQGRARAACLAGAECPVHGAQVAGHPLDAGGNGLHLEPGRRKEAAQRQPPEEAGQAILDGVKNYFEPIPAARDAAGA